MIYLIIETNAILAQGGIIGALVDVGALLAVAAEPVVADALERPEGVQAARVCVAAAIVGRACVDVLRKNKTRFKTGFVTSAFVYKNIFQLACNIIFDNLMTFRYVD